ncbi:MAG TPA: hypothetical protein VFG04_19800 [Planctomycetaceae bacterium]|jgi:hypothetical protein|nr:hypothetical protein [Planctomycetaceae bacterium]
MNQAHHDHPGHHAGHHTDHQHENKPGKQYHKDWRVWVALVVILAAMATYVITNGEVIRPVSVPPSEVAPVNK